MRRYHIQDRDDYAKYNRLCGSIHHLALRLSKLPSTDPFREKTESSLLGKCYDMGLVDVGNKMSDLFKKVTVSSFARRRLGVVMVRLKMSETVKQVCNVDLAFFNNFQSLISLPLFRQSHISSKDRSELVQTPLPILRFSSQETWKTLSRGLISLESESPLQDIQESTTITTCYDYSFFSFLIICTTLQCQSRDNSTFFPL